jgi:hypothetical protein
VDLEWQMGQMVATTIHSTGGRICQVRAGARVTEVKLKPGHSIILDAGLQVFGP